MVYNCAADVQGCVCGALHATDDEAVDCSSLSCGRAEVYTGEETRVDKLQLPAPYADEPGLVLTRQTLRRFKHCVFPPRATLNVGYATM